MSPFRPQAVAAPAIFRAGSKSDVFIGLYYTFSGVNLRVQICLWLLPFRCAHLSAKATA